MVIPRKLRMLMTDRTIADLQRKMDIIRKIPQNEQTYLFFSMCDFGLELYIQTEQKRFPGKTKKQIMREYYIARGNH